MQFTILDKDFKMVETFDVYESLIWNDKFNGYGDFQIITDIGQLNKFVDNAYITSYDSEEVMCIETIQITTDVDRGTKLRVSGRSIESILERRIVWSQTTFDGNFQTCIQTLLNSNVISPSVSDRQIPNFIFEPSVDPVITALTLKVQLYGETLYETIQTLCDTNAIGFKIVLTDDLKLKFMLYRGVDRSYSQSVNTYVLFSPKFDNLFDSTYKESSIPLKTITLVVGEGEGTARKTKTVSIEAGAGVGMNRRELFTDANDVSTNNGEISEATYLTLLEQRGKESLAENISINEFEGRADFNSTYVYGRDFFLGDLVQIRNEYGLEARSRVDEIVYSYSDRAIEIYPVFKNI